MRPPILVYGLTGLVLGSLAIGLATARRMEAQNFNLVQPSSDRFAQAAPTPGGQMGMQHDRHFIENMIPHHKAAVKMADLALVQAKHPELRQLAAVIKSAQTQEIQEMQRWYKQWYGMEVPSTGMGSMGMMGRSNNSRGMHSGMMNGMGMQSDLTALKQAADFDREFIRQMIPHHQMAVMMSSMILNSEHSELRSLAQSIIQSQTAEIRQMQQWYQSWYS